MVAAPSEALSFNAVDLIMSRINIIGWACGDNRDSEDTMQFAVDCSMFSFIKIIYFFLYCFINLLHVLDVHPKIEVFPLEKVQEAYDKMVNNTVRFRSVIRMP